MDRNHLRILPALCALAAACGPMAGTTQPEWADTSWFIALERSFNNYRCYTDAVLREELQKYGVAY